MEFASSLYLSISSLLVAVLSAIGAWDGFTAVISRMPHPEQSAVTPAARATQSSARIVGENFIGGTNNSI
jgi:hypothetical protein